MRLHVLPGSPKHDLPSLDPESLGEPRVPVATVLYSISDFESQSQVPTCNYSFQVNGSWYTVQIRVNHLQVSVYPTCTRLHCLTLDPSSGSLPFLELESGQSVAGSAILHNLLSSTTRAQKFKLEPAAASEAVAFQALLDTTVLPLTLHSLYSVSLCVHILSQRSSPADCDRSGRSATSKLDIHQTVDCR